MAAFYYVVYDTKGEERVYWNINRAIMGLVDLHYELLLDGNKHVIKRFRGKADYRLAKMQVGVRYPYMKIDDREIGIEIRIQQPETEPTSEPVRQFRG